MNWDETTPLSPTNLNDLEQRIAAAMNDVDQGKNDLYNALINQGVTPTSQNFADLVTAIGNIIKATGNANVADVLSGKTFSNGTDNNLTGTMANNDAIIITPSTGNQAIQKGFHNGNGYVIGDSDLISDNIKSGITIFGVEGDPYVVDTSAGNAAANQILNGIKAYVDGSLITGNIPSKGGQTYTPATTDQIIDGGMYLSGNQTIKGDADLLADNIKKDVDIFGVIGTHNDMEFTAGNNVRCNDAMTVRHEVNWYDNILARQITILKAGVYNVSAECYYNGSSYELEAKIYHNGNYKGGNWHIASGWETASVSNINCAAGDVIALRLMTDGIGTSAVFSRNFKIKSAEPAHFQIDTPSVGDYDKDNEP